MSDLSPAAQAVMDACTDAPIQINWATKLAAAAALRAAADQVVPEEQEPARNEDSVLEMQMWARVNQRQRTRFQLLAIVAELEGVKYGTYRCNLKEK